MIHLAWIAPLVLLIIYLSSPRHRGDIAESRVRRILASGLERNRYTILNDVLLPSGGGSVRIDHLVVSRFGIFVIESQYATGWVSGTPVQDRWKQTVLGRITRFDNPVGLNQRQVLAVQSMLGLPSRMVHGMVVMVGPRGFKTDMPDYVVTPEKLISSLRKKGQLLLSPEQAAQASSAIDAARLKPAGGFYVDRGLLVRVALLAVLAVGLYLAFGDRFGLWLDEWRLEAAKRHSPGDYHADGSPKTEQELWEESLRCAWSPDTGRCACYAPDGDRVELNLAKCRELAEKDSVLNR